MTPGHFAAQVRSRRMVTALSGKRHRRHAIPRQAQPNAIRLAYAQALQGIIGRAHRLVRAALEPRFAQLAAVASQVHDAVRSYPDEVQDLVEQAAGRLFTEFPNEKLRQLALRMAHRTSDHNREQLNRQMAAAFGKDISIDIFAERGVRERLEAFAAANVRLVKKVPQQFFDEVGSRVVRSLRSGQRAEELQAEIQDRYGVAESKARLIARDQIGRLNAELNQARQQDLGITQFRWGASHDERECDECEPYDGNIYSWDDPPSDGLPGEVHPGCRCVGEPLVQEIIDAL